MRQRRQARCARGFVHESESRALSLEACAEFPELVVLATTSESNIFGECVGLQLWLVEVYFNPLHSSHRVRSTGLVLKSLKLAEDLAASVANEERLRLVSQMAAADLFSMRRAFTLQSRRHFKSHLCVAAIFVFPRFVLGCPFGSSLCTHVAVVFTCH